MAIQQTNGQDPFEYFPEELGMAVLACLEEPEDLGRCSQVSKKWHRLSNDNCLWRAHCKRIIPGESIPRGISIKEFFYLRTISSVDELKYRLQLFYNDAKLGENRSFECKFVKYPDCFVILEVKTINNENHDSIKRYVMYGELASELGENCRVSYSAVQPSPIHGKYFEHNVRGIIPEQLKEDLYGFECENFEVLRPHVFGHIEQPPQQRSNRLKALGAIAVVVGGVALHMYLKYSKPE